MTEETSIRTVTRARSSYEDFLKLWKDDDADIPILKEAWAEYAKLQWWGKFL